MVIQTKTPAQHATRPHTSLENAGDAAAQIAQPKAGLLEAAIQI